jgi:hypothetical protein
MKANRDEQPIYGINGQIQYFGFAGSNEKDELCGSEPGTVVTGFFITLNNDHITPSFRMIDFNHALPHVVLTPMLTLQGFLEEPH